MAYFTLCTFEPELDAWAPQFGDYDRETVAEEAAEYPEQKTKIIRTATARQSDINAAVDKLNGNGDWRNR